MGSASPSSAWAGVAATASGSSVTLEPSVARGRRFASGGTRSSTASVTEGGSRARPGDRPAHGHLPSPHPGARAGPVRGRHRRPAARRRRRARRRPPCPPRRAAASAARRDRRVRHLPRGPRAARRGAARRGPRLRPGRRALPPDRGRTLAARGPRTPGAHRARLAPGADAARGHPDPPIAATRGRGRAARRLRDHDGRADAARHRDPVRARRAGPGAARGRVPPRHAAGGSRRPPAPWSPGQREAPGGDRAARPRVGEMRSRLERRFRSLLVRHGIPLPRRNVTLGPWIVDCLWPELGVVVELDGRQHARPGQAAVDARRDLWLRANGYVVLRYTWQQVTEDSDAVVADLLAALGARRSG
ncbi:DUF559 domain-containing protein [Conexibacter sp. W3-3-2]|nr:DUF559 domain-containing protein [Conexibacter sp. W3-3-2]